MLATPAVGTPSPWTNLTLNLTTAPSPREGAEMAYDPIDGRVLLFGGLLHNRTASDTWEFANGTWTNLTPYLPLSPPGRYKGGLVFDSEDNEMILFGGHSGPTYRNDTWAFNGSAWNQVFSTVSPGPREDVAIADDMGDHYVLMFGGEAPSGLLNNDTWTFSGGQWTNQTNLVSAPPPPREAGGLTYDGSDHYVLLFSGKHGTSGLLWDTWTFSAGLWANLTTRLLVQHPPREALRLKFDCVARIMLMQTRFT
jgi:hypothetical protein